VTRFKEIISISLLTILLLVGCGKKNVENNAQELTYHSADLSAKNINIEHEGNQIQIKSDVELLDGLVLSDNERGCYILDESRELQNIHICQTPAIVSIYAFVKNANNKIQPIKFVFKRTLINSPNEDQSKIPSNSKLETPKSYTISDLVNITKQKSFTTRQELDQLKMAKTNMRLHYLNLLPHLSMNSAIALATFSGPLSILGSIGDLVPFLLPNRWIQAKETEHLYKAEVIGSKIAREDSIQLVEGLAFSVARDQKMFDLFVSYRSQFIDNIKLVRNLEDHGNLPFGRYRDIESPLSLFDQMISSLANIIESEQAELSFAVGFHNPDAIKNIEIGNLIEATNVNDNKIEIDIISKTLSSSLELSQMDEVIKASELDKKDKFFEWLDPAGDSQAGLGLGLPLNIALSKENVQYLRHVKEQLEATLIQKISFSQKDFITCSSNYIQSMNGIDLQTKRIKVAIDELMSNPNDTPLGELQDSLNQLVVQQANLMSAKFAYLSAQSRINRLLHLGLYQSK
jgi:hypothetical protein